MKQPTHRLRAVMAERNLNAADVARRLAPLVEAEVPGLTVTVRKYRTGRAEPSGDRWQLLAAVLDVPLEQLRPGIEPPALRVRIEPVDQLALAA